ncbi:MAG: hypothetical protein ACEPO2_00965 [Pelagibaca sp.]
MPSFFKTSLKTSVHLGKVSVHILEVARLIIQKDPLQIGMQLFLRGARQVAGGRNRYQARPGIWVEVFGLRQTYHSAQLAVDGLTFLAITSDGDLAS